MRRGEIYGLRVEDFDFQNMVLHIKHNGITKDGKIILSEPKTKSSIRDILIDQKTVELILNYTYARKANKQGLLLRDKKGKAIYETKINKDFRKICKDLDIERMRFHDLRHSYATNMIQAGVPATIVSNVLGHSDIKTTLSIYTHTCTDMQKACLSVLENKI